MMGLHVDAQILHALIHRDNANVLLSKFGCQKLANVLHMQIVITNLRCALDWEILYTH